MKRLLIVDDNEDHRLILRTMLEAKGYACEEAEDGTDALEQLVAVPMDLVVTDLNMPRTDGLQLIVQMGERTQLQKIPVILMTSQASGEVPQSAHIGKPHTVLPKPYERQKILAAVACAIDSSNTNSLPDSKSQIHQCL